MHNLHREHYDKIMIKMMFTLDERDNDGVISERGRKFFDGVILNRQGAKIFLSLFSLENK